SSLSEKISEFLLREAPLSLGDITWNRNSRPTQLGSESEKLVLRKPGRRAIGSGDQIHRFLPSHQIFIGSSHLDPSRGHRITGGWQLAIHCTSLSWCRSQTPLHL